MHVTHRLMIRGLGSLVIVAFLLSSTTSPAQTTVDPIEKLRQTLSTTVDDLSERDERTKACLGELHSLSELRKAVVLREWRQRTTNAELTAIDRANRNALAEHFRSKAHEVLSGRTPGPTLAVLQILGDTVVSLRALGEPATLTGPLAADVARLVGDANPAIRAAAVRTLALIGPDGFIALPILTELAKSTDPARRLDAASALDQLLQTRAQPWTAQMFNPATQSGRRATAESVAKLLPLVSAGVLDPNPDVRRRSLTTLTLAATLFDRMTLPPRGAETLDLNEMRPLALVLQDSMTGVAHCLRDPEADVKGQALTVLEEEALGWLHWLQQPTGTTQPNEEPDDPLASGRGAALPALAMTLPDAEVTVGRTTLDVLEIYGPLASAAVPAVMLALEDRDRYVRHEDRRYGCWARSVRRRGRGFPR